MNPTQANPTRRAFLHHTTHLIIGGCALAVIGCGDSDEEDIGINPITPKPTPRPELQPEPEPRDDEPEQPANGARVKMANALKKPGGTQKVNDRDVLNALETKRILLLVRVDDKSVAANSISCTHQGCNVNYDKNQKRLDCPCHGSRFDLNGEVLRGPAVRPLEHFKATIEENSILLEKA
jgi:Rieske Fe-S protein